VGVSFEKQAEGSQEQALGGGEETEIAHLHETSGQDMLEKAMDELFGGEGTERDLAGSGRAVAKGDLVVFEFDQAAIADSDPEDVGCQVLEGSAAVADRFAVDHPILLPDGGWDAVGEAGSLKGVMEFGSEDPGEGFDWEQEMMVGREPGAVIGGQPTGRDEIVNVRMVGQVASPGVQDTDQTELSPDKTGVLGQMLCCSRRGTKEQVIDKRLVTAGEWAQGGGQGEGEHEVRDWQQKILLFLQPFLGFVVLALGAVTVPAGVVAELKLVALRAGVDLPTQGGCAAQLNSAHSPSMAVEQAIGVFLAIGRAVAAEYVCQF
jgi:hypothetical protein